MPEGCQASESPAISHYEWQYLDLVRRVWTSGDEQTDRTGVGTRSLFGESMRFSLAGQAVPLLTTKRVYWKTAAREMLWFLSGGTNIRPLVEQNVHIWTDWPLEKYNKATGSSLDRAGFEARILEDVAFAEKWGELGPVYGKQWRAWPVFDANRDGTYTRRKQGIDQISDLVSSLKNNPASRRHIVEGWNVAELDQMALPPCHKTYQFRVAKGRLSCVLYQRSCDLGLGFAFNVFSAALLTRMIAQQCELEAEELIWMGGDVHLYLNHEELVEEQLSRSPSGFPTLKLARRPASMFDYEIEDVIVENYSPQGHISAPVAV